MSINYGTLMDEKGNEYYPNNGRRAHVFIADGEGQLNCWYKVFEFEATNYTRYMFTFDIIQNGPTHPASGKLALYILGNGDNGIWERSLRWETMSAPFHLNNFWIVENNANVALYVKNGTAYTSYSIEVTDATNYTDEYVTEYMVYSYNRVPSGLASLPSGTQTRSEYISYELSKTPVGEFLLWEGNYYGYDNSTFQQIACYYSPMNKINELYPKRYGFKRKYKLVCDYTTTNILDSAGYFFVRFQDAFGGVVRTEMLFPNVWGATEDGIRSRHVLDFEAEDVLKGHQDIFVTPSWGSGASFRIYRLSILIYDELDCE